MARLEVKRSYAVLQLDDWIVNLCPLREPTVVSLHQSLLSPCAFLADFYVGNCYNICLTS